MLLKCGLFISAKKKPALTLGPLTLISPVISYFAAFSNFNAGELIQ